MTAVIWNTDSLSKYLFFLWFHVPARECPTRGLFSLVANATCVPAAATTTTSITAVDVIAKAATIASTSKYQIAKLILP